MEESAKRPSRTSRIKGSIYGVAVTDALGGPVEFKRRGTFPLVTKYRYNGNFDLAPGTWTDDTSMTLCLGQSLIEKSGVFDPLDQVSKFVAWSKNGYMSATGECFDIGITTSTALSYWSKLIQSSPADTAYEIGQKGIVQGLGSQRNCGNGSLMRTSAIALVYHESPSVMEKNARLSSDLTHPYKTNSEACVLYTSLIAGSLKGSSKAELASKVSCFDYKVDDLRARLSGYVSIDSFVAKLEDQISSSGYVIDTLEAALWSFFTTENFREGALKVVNLGSDADTVGAVYGGLAGAFYGLEAIPDEWLVGLEKREMVEEVAEGLAKLQVQPDEG
ncbi:MAG: hypothetical protein M4579_001928 [Chaenotheca gracillima]|nr:MAG: hypothetical protein M4579_001928 [Chaenotheca gracillima]